MTAKPMLKVDRRLRPKTVSMALEFSVPDSVPELLAAFEEAERKARSVRSITNAEERSHVY